MSYSEAAQWQPGDPIDSLPPGLIREARNWVEDCTWREEPEDLEEYPDETITRGVNRHYDGGWRQFVTDGHYWEMDELERDQ